MHLKSLSLRFVRNYPALELKLGPGLNLFFGDNAQGKTNLLEAACFLGSLRSFRGVKGAALVAWDESEGMIKGETAGGPGGRAGGPGGNNTRKGSGACRRLQVTISEGKRRVMLDGKRPGSAREYLQAFKTSSFSPEDLFLVKEYPSHRRRFLDRSIFHLQPGYLELANRYRAAVGQLNAALKLRDRKVAISWEEVLAPLAADVNFRRRAQVESLRPLAAELYARVLGLGSLEVSYRSPAKGDDKAALEESYRALMEKKREDGFRRGCCQAGPHTDDLTITLSGRELKVSASRGQGRLTLLALVLADSELYRARTGDTPVLLLDDVVSELDERRKSALLDYISGAGQALLTSTDGGLIKGRGGMEFKVESNRVTAA